MGRLSVKVTTWVWEHSRSRGPARLVLLAIADNAHDDGAQAWPSMTTLVRKTGLSERTVHRAIKQLMGLGELTVEYNAGPGLCNLYRVRMTPVNLTPPSERHPRQPDTPVRDAGVSERHPTPVREAPLPPSEWHPEPSIEPSVNRQVPPSADATPAVVTSIPTAQTYIAAYVDAYRGRTGHDPPSRVKGHLARELGRLFDDGIPPDTIKAGFEEWFEADAHPSTLSSFVESKGRGGRSRGRTRQQRERDQLVQYDQEMQQWANRRMRERGDNGERAGVVDADPAPQPQLPRPGTAP